jgi:hypothetical protein
LVQNPHICIAYIGTPGMHFFYPSFLFALLFLAIPVLIHLFNFRRYQKVYFSNVQFLKEIQEQQSSRRNLKERLVLASRMLAIAFLVLAFAKPYFSDRNSTQAGKQRTVSIFIDNSYSMQTLNREGSLLDEAKRRAKELVSAYNVNDRFQLLTQDFEGKYQRLLSREEFNDAVDAVKISPQSRSLQQILNRQEGLQETKKDNKRSIFIISDFQKNMSDGQPIKTDTGLSVNLVQLKANSLPNVAVDSVLMVNSIHQPGESERLVVRLHNYADEDAQAVPLKLIINNAQKAFGSYTIKARAVQYDTLKFSGLQSGWQRAQLSLQDNPVNFDNQFYFSFNVNQHMPVLLIDGGSPGPYLKAVFATDRFFDVKRVPAGNVDYASLSTYPFIVISDIQSISTGLSQQLQIYVSKGGTLLVFPSTDTDLKSYQAFLQSMNAAYPEKLIEGPAKVTGINLQNQIFKTIFERQPQNPDLPVVKKYYQLSSSVNERQENLMDLPGKKAFWAGYGYKKGKVYVCAVPLSEDFSNLPRHALFVPVIFRMALLSGHDQPLFYTIGREQTLEIPPVQINTRQVLKMVKGNTTIIPDARHPEGNTLLFIADQVKETGIYDLRKADSTVAVLAFNDSRSESDLSYFSDNGLHKIMPQANSIIQTGRGTLKDVPTETNFGLQLWKLCIILALISLAVEIALIRYLKTGSNMSNVT